MLPILRRKPTPDPEPPQRLHPLQYLLMLWLKKIQTGSEEEPLPGMDLKLSFLFRSVARAGTPLMKTLSFDSCENVCDFINAANAWLCKQRNVEVAPTHSVADGSGGARRADGQRENNARALSLEP